MFFAVHNNTKLSDGWVCTNSVDQDRHRLSFLLLHFDALLYGKTALLKFYYNNSNLFGCPSLIVILVRKYCNVPEFWDRQVLVNSVEEQSYLGLHCLLFCLYVLGQFISSKTILF